MFVRSICVLILCASAMPAWALTLRLCTDEHSRLPFTTPGGEGLSDKLILAAAKEVGITVQFRPAPIIRCREEVRADAADGFPTVPYTASLQGFFAFPMNGKEADPARAVTTARAMVYRRAGHPVDWDGKRFAQLATPVLVPAGAVLLLDRLGAMKVAIDDSSKGLESNFAKLAAGRADLAIGSEYTGMVLMNQAQYKDKVEVLPAPFSDEAYYLGVSKTFQLAHPREVERLWEAIARIRRSPDYQRSLRRAMEEAAKAEKE